MELFSQNNYAEASVLLRKMFSSVPNGFFILFLLDVIGVLFIEVSNTGLAFIVFSSAYLFCMTGSYVIYRVLLNGVG
jgi:hypothetical protein